MNSLETIQLERLLHLFNSLQDDADRLSFFRQWEQFVRSLSAEGQQTAYVRLIEAVVGGLQDFVDNLLQYLVSEPQARASEFLSTIPNESK